MVNGMVTHTPELFHLMASLQACYGTLLTSLTIIDELCIQYPSMFIPSKAKVSMISLSNLPKKCNAQIEVKVYFTVE
ncbi:CLUMA_CG015661, isoform A [Clunio marinus]|uniref:CLUMA_CG015661, isoform A n=1 Tax=Clunio marinus TaxID=568069 RepID=A0A1J1IQ43_9DIPT|nr:CLUMA_CG015661, isoform A [Clunio marinus]